MNGTIIRRLDHFRRRGAIMEQPPLYLLKGDSGLRGVFGGIQADVQDKSGPEHRRREAAQVDARRRQKRGQLGGNPRPVLVFDADRAHASGQIEAQGGGGFEFRVTAQGGDKYLPPAGRRSV